MILYLESLPKLKQQLNRIQILYKEWFFPATEKQLVIYEPDWNYKNCCSNNFDKSAVYSIHIFLPQQLPVCSIPFMPSSCPSDKKYPSPSARSIPIYSTIEIYKYHFDILRIMFPFFSLNTSFQITFFKIQ